MKSVLVKVTSGDDRDPATLVKQLEALARTYNHIDDTVTFEIGVKAKAKPRKKARKKK